MEHDIKNNSKLMKKAVNAWVMYDWANSAFATTVMGVVLPTYFADYIADGPSGPIWGQAVAIGSLLAAVLSPILGAIADFKASKKKFMAFFAALGIISTALLWFVVGPAQQTLCIILYILGTVGFAGSLVFYDSLLPHVSKDDNEMDQISSKGYALGYIGGGLLLLINALMIFFGPRLLPNMPESEAVALMMRLSLLSVAIGGRSFPFRSYDVPEPPARGEESELGKHVIASVLDAWRKHSPAFVNSKTSSSS